MQTIACILPRQSAPALTGLRTNSSVGDTLYVLRGVVGLHVLHGDEFIFPNEWLKRQLTLST